MGRGRSRKFVQRVLRLRAALINREVERCLIERGYRRDAEGRWRKVSHGQS